MGALNNYTYVIIHIFRLGLGHRSLKKWALMRSQAIFEFAFDTSLNVWFHIIFYEFNYFVRVEKSLRSSSSFKVDVS